MKKLCYAAALLCAASFVTAEQPVVFADYSNGLKDWKLKEYSGKSNFQIQQQPKAMVTLVSNRTSFGLAKNQKFNMSKIPYLNFEWMVENIPEKGDLRNKKTDDQAAQIYVTIPSFPEMINYKSIGYVWDSNAPQGKYQSQKIGNIKFIVLRSGKNGLGQWFSEKRNVYEDFKELWNMDLKKEKKVVVSINIDSDDTKSFAKASFGNIYFSEK